jgi:energy-coupling factor transport system permease protein
VHEQRRTGARPTPATRRRSTDGSFALIATLDPVAPAIAGAAELAVVPLFGVRYAALARRAWPLLVTALGIVLTLVLFAAERTGSPLFAVGPVAVTTGVLAGAGLLGAAAVAVSIALGTFRPLLG